MVVHRRGRHRELDGSSPPPGPLHVAFPSSRMGRRGGGPHEARGCLLVRRFAGRDRKALRRDGRRREPDPARSGQASRLVSTRAATSTTSPASKTARSSAARRSPRTPVRPTTGATRPKCTPLLRRILAGCMRGRTMYVHPVSDGAAQKPDGTRRRRDHRQPVRRRQHADHDADGPGRARRAGRDAATSCKGIHSTSPARPGQALHQPFPRRKPGDQRQLELRRQRPLGQEVFCPAAGQRAGPATKVGWPSTC